MTVIFNFVLLIVIVGFAAFILTGAVNLTKVLSFYSKSTEDDPVVKKYKLSGISCTGTSPRIVREEGMDAGIELTYEIDGRRITGSHDSHFAMDEITARAIAGSGEPAEICVHPDNEKVFCFMDELYRQKKVYNPEKALRFGWTYGEKVKGVIAMTAAVIILLLLLFIKFSI